MRSTPLGLVAGAVAALAFLSLPHCPARADLLIDPSGGTTLTFPTLDDSGVARDLQGTFTFYGVALTEIGVSTNGYLAPAASDLGLYADRDLPPLGMDAVGPAAAVLYDDHDFYDGGSVVENVLPGHYYAATWIDAPTFGYLPSAGTNTFQGVLFTGPTTIREFSFGAGDILFGYSHLTAPIDRATATVGIVNDDGTQSVPLPGTTDGQITDYSLLLPLTIGDPYLLFRFNDIEGVYSASILTPSGPTPGAPEPGALSFIAAPGLAALALLRRRRATASRPRAH